MLKIGIALQLPRDRDTVGLVRRFSTAGLDELGLTEECSSVIQVALSEACSNIVEHADNSDDYKVELSVDDWLCEITVVDTGRGFDHESLGHDFPDPNEAQGRGVALMRSLMDATSFRSEPQSGTVVHLTKIVDYRDDSPVLDVVGPRPESLDALPGR